MSKIAQTHIHREDGVYFVSTVNRGSSSMLAPDMRYAETMAWGPAGTGNMSKQVDDRGPLVFQDSAPEGSISGHIGACVLIFEHGSKAQEVRDEEVS
jgi:hypothetical protein